MIQRKHLTLVPYMVLDAKVDIHEPALREAVAAKDAGDLSRLQQILHTQPELVEQRLTHPAEGYFSYPYLLWFVADNPIRNEQLAQNIAGITGLLLDIAKQNAADSFQSQINYTLGLVATGRLERECGVQTEMMDLLLNAGAMPGTGLAALAHGNVQAAEYLLERGAVLTLPSAVGLGRDNDARQLLKHAAKSELDLALVAASFFARTHLMQLLIDAGANACLSQHGKWFPCSWYCLAPGGVFRFNDSSSPAHSSQRGSYRKR